MAITHRYGKLEDFDEYKMLPHEWAFPDDGTGRYCVAPGVVKTVTTREDLQEILNVSPEAYTALQELISDLNNDTTLTETILSGLDNAETDLHSIDTKYQPTKDTVDYYEYILNNESMTFADLVNNVSNNGATLVDLTSDTGWQNISLTKGTPYTAGVYPKYRKFGSMVQITGVIKGLTDIASAAISQFATIPTEIRPPETFSALAQGTSACIWLLTVDAGGFLGASRYREGALYKTDLTGNEWLSFHVAYFVD